MINIYDGVTVPKPKIYNKRKKHYDDNIFTFDIDGQTKDVIYPADGDCSGNSNIQCTQG